MPGVWTTGLGTSPKVTVNLTRYPERNKAFVLAYLRVHPCVDRGESDPTVLEFDHVGTKLRTVSSLKWGSATIERIQSEIEQCEVRCVNCHLRRTAAQLGWRKGQHFGDNPDLFEPPD